MARLSKDQKSQVIKALSYRTLSPEDREVEEITRSRAVSVFVRCLHLAWPESEREAFRRLGCAVRVKTFCAQVRGDDGRLKRIDVPVHPDWRDDVSYGYGHPAKPEEYDRAVEIPLSLIASNCNDNARALQTVLGGPFANDIEAAAQAYRDLRSVTREREQQKNLALVALVESCSTHEALLEALPEEWHADVRSALSSSSTPADLDAARKVLGIQKTT